MRLIDIITEQQIDEVSMSPGALADFAKTEFAQSMTAGFEAELVIPNAQSDDDGEMEPDYDYDTRCNSFEDIREFFEGDYNGSRQIERAVEEINEKFFEYADEQIMDEFENEKDEMIRQYLKDDGKLETEIEEIMDDPDSREYQKAYDQAQEEFRDGADYDSYTRNFFRNNYPYMSDIANETGLDWPYWSNSSSGDGESGEEVAREIADAIGMPVKASSGYHGMKRGTGFFILEPDSSIDYDSGEGEAGLELVSPPMPLVQCLEYLDKVFKWANDRGCSTNSSTGFHMGVSIPNQTSENVDHLKFTLFLGDEYVLKQFGRESNSYAKSMVRQMSQKLKNLGAGSGNMDAERMLRAFRDGMNSSAAKFIKTSLTTTNDRYVTVNIKDKYIEVRSAGGDYLDDLPKIKNTLLRYVRAMGLAADPEAEKQEYAKKLYKFISPMVSGDDDIIKYFTQYNAGLLPVKGLKGLLRQAQQNRADKKNPPKDNSIGTGPNLYLFRTIDITDNKMHEVKVRGTSRQNAIKTFRENGFVEQEWNIYKIEDINITDNSEAERNARERAPGSTIYRMTYNDGTYLGTFAVDNIMDAYSKANERAQAFGLTSNDWKLFGPNGNQVYPSVPGDFVDDPMAASSTAASSNAASSAATAGTYIITYLDTTGAQHQTAYDANSASDAEELFRGSHPRSYQIVNTAIA